MKATLSFNLPEERDEHHNAINGTAYRSALDAIDQWARSKVKYADLPEDQANLYQEIRDLIRAELDGLEL